MKFHNHLVTRAMVFALLIGLSMVTFVSAITIVVDGTREAVSDTGVGGQLPSIQNDANDVNELAIGDGYDVEQVLWTNDQTIFYDASYIATLALVGAFGLALLRFATVQKRR